MTHCRPEEILVITKIRPTLRTVSAAVLKLGCRRRAEGPTVEPGPLAWWPGPLLNLQSHGWLTIPGHAKVWQACPTWAGVLMVPGVGSDCGPAGTPGSQLQEGREHHYPSRTRLCKINVTSWLHFSLVSNCLTKFQGRKLNELFSSLLLQGAGT